MANELNGYYLQAMGITQYLLREPVPASKEQQFSLLAEQARACQNCPLHQTRKQVVFSRGNFNANLMVIGEAPGFYEDQQGLPFVGKAGQLLNCMLASIGLDEDAVYITNVLKCRPPENRDPEAFEIQQCSHFLTEQIACKAPRLILALGRFAGQFLCENTTPLAQLRNRIHRYQDTPVIVSYHPAYLLRNPKDKKKAFTDLRRVKDFLEADGG
ncbi:MAG: uracil-DNA glycosylase [Tatlockia sp.]|jgi:DNA polymerase